MLQIKTEMVTIKWVKSVLFSTKFIKIVLTRKLANNCIALWDDKDLCGGGVEAPMRNCTNQDLFH